MYFPKDPDSGSFLSMSVSVYVCIYVCVAEEDGMEAQRETCYLVRFPQVPDIPEAERERENRSKFYARV